MTVTDGTPRVSVVIPTHNRAADLRRCLHSLRAQSVPDFEVLVCDDGSTDGSADVVAEFRDLLRVSYHWAENWGGAARPRNRGIALASAPYVAFLDSDDWWTPDKLERSLEALDAGADVVYHDLYRVDDAQRVARPRGRVRSWALRPPVFDSLMDTGNAIPLSSAVVRTAVLRRAGGMPEDRALIAMEDYACWFQLARLSERFVRVRGTLGYYWAGGGNISSDARTLTLLDVFEEHHREHPAWRGTPAWIAYTRARIHFRAHRYDAAREQLAALGQRQVPWSIRLKALATHVAMFWPHEAGSGA